MNAITKGMLTFFLVATITFLYLHYFPGLTRSFRYREPLSANASVRDAILSGLIGVLIFLRKRN
jgi:hypothetical protein